MSAPIAGAHASAITAIAIPGVLRMAVSWLAVTATVCDLSLLSSKRGEAARLPIALRDHRASAAAPRRKTRACGIDRLRQRPRQPESHDDVAVVGGISFAG